MAITSASIVRSSVFFRDHVPHISGIKVARCAWTSRSPRASPHGPARAVSTSGSAETVDQQKPKWDIRMLYDGECPLCMREVNMLKGRDEGIGKIDFVDISNPNYSEEDNANLTYEEAMGEIHAILPDGRVVKNVEVFRRLYEAVGLGWIYAVTKIGPIGKAANWVYGLWARYRMQITGRSDLATVIAEKKSCKIR